MGNKTKLYDKLGVGKDADVSQIKKAYRKKAKEVHPDTGGSEKEFEELHRAYAILSNRKTREKYDATVDDSLNEPDNKQSQIMMIIAGALENAITYCEQNRRDPLEFDIVSKMKDILQSEIGKCETKISNFNVLIKKTERLLGKFRVKEGNNFIEQMLFSKIVNINQHISIIESEKEPLKKAYDLLKLVEFDFKLKENEVENPYHQFNDIMGMIARDL